MASPLPLTQIFAFRAPIVKAGEIVLPVTVASPEGGRMEAGLSGDRLMMRKLAHDLLAATCNDAPKGRPPVVEPMLSAAEAGRPLFKTGRRIS